jgi:uncharacterized membrane protein YbhN (UPF0104 family)
MAISMVLLVRMAITHQSEIGRAIDELLSRSGWLVLGAVLLEVVWTYCLANVYRSSLLAFGGRLRRGQAVRISMGAFSLSRILPGGGAAGSVFAAREMVGAGNAVPRTVVSMLVAWWVSMTSLALIVGTGTALGIPGEVGWPHLIGPGVVVAVLAVVGGLALAAGRHPRLRRRLAGMLSTAGSRLRVTATRQEWEEAMTSLPIRRMWPLVGWAAGSWVVDAAALWLMFLGFGITLHPAVLLVGYGLANLINALPEATPGWVGVLETALAASYAALGVPAGVAVVAVLSYRLVSYWLPVIAGIAPGLAMLRGGPGKPAPENRFAVLGKAA